MPADSRVRPRRLASSERLREPENLERVRALDEIAERRGQTLAQMALAWALRDPRVTSASSVPAVSSSSSRTSPRWNTSTSIADELGEIDRYAQESGINLWPPSS